MRGNRSIHQFHSGTHPRDAITNSMFLIKNILNENGIESNIYAEHLHPELIGRIYSCDKINVNKDDVLIIHHSFENGVLDYITGLSCHKILLFHNITKPIFFEEGSALQAGATRGFGQLWQLRDVVSGAITDSDFNATELANRGFSNIQTIFLLKDLEILPDLPFEPAGSSGDPEQLHLMFVGRVVENKGHDALIAALPILQKYLGRRVKLSICGEYDENSSYFSSLVTEVNQRQIKDSVTFLGSVSNERLLGLYRTADAYVSFSEHEGFGVPLLEAMALGTPVIAYACTAIAETVGNGGILLGDREPETLAYVLRKLTASRTFRRSVIRRQREHLSKFSMIANIEKLFGFLQSTVGFSRPSQACAKKPISQQRQITVQGAARGSYSLSIVNRGFIKALQESTKWGRRLAPLDDIHLPNSESIVASLPEDLKALATRPFCASEPSVGVRSNYPMRPRDMIDDVRLAYLFWEESELPPELVWEINLKLDALIAPSKFCAKVFRESGVNVPICVVGCGMDNGLNIGEELASAAVSEAQKWPFIFLHVSSGLERKGILELLQAYRRAFCRRDHVLLKIKSYHNPTNVIDRYLRDVATHPDSAPIDVIYDEYTDLEMQSLYQSSDVVVLPTKGEGYNLPAAEALHYKKNIIVTGYGGHMDFCNTDNAILLDYVLEPSQTHLKTFNSYWARPNIDQLASSMRFLYDEAVCGHVQR